MIPTTFSLCADLDMQTDDAWNVFVVEYGCSTQPWASLVCDTYNEGMVDLPLSFIVARQGDQIILIDTGFMGSAANHR